MTAETFFANFGHLADAPNGVQKLRELILQLAVQGKLVPQDQSDEPASILLVRIEAEKKKLEKEGKIKKVKPTLEVKQEKQPYELPKGWSWSRLGNLAEVNGGFAFKSTNYTDDGMRVVRISDFDERGFKNNKVVRHPYSDELHSFRLNEDNILMAMTGGTVGKSLLVKVLSEQMVVNQRVATIKIMTGVVPEYINGLIRTNLIQDVIKAAKNSTNDNISMGDILTFLVPLPPLKEQKRIIAKVDQLMTRCDELEARQQKQQQGRIRLNNSALDAILTARKPDEFANHWQRICNNFDLLYDHPGTIAKLRAAILQLAVQGKLVPQDPNDEPASVLLERVKIEKERLVKEGKIKKQKRLPAIKDEKKPFDLPVGWKWSRIWDVAEMITSGSRGWAKYYSDRGPIFVTMGNLSRGHYKLRMKTIRHVNPPLTGEGSRTKLVENDLLISITGDVGNLGLIPKNFGEAYINQHTCLLRFMPQCQNRYFPELLRSPLAKLQYDAPQRGIKNSFRLGDVGEMLIPIPPLQEQKRIVTKVNQLMALCDELEAKLNQAQQHNEKLMTATVKQFLVA